MMPRSLPRAYAANEVSRGSKRCLSYKLKVDRELTWQRVVARRGCIPDKHQHVQVPWEGHTGAGSWSWGQEATAGTA